MSHKDWIIIGCITLFAGIIGFAIDRALRPKQVEETAIKDGRYIKMSDSLLMRNNQNKDTIKVLYQHIHQWDSLSLLNIKQITHDKKIIKNFTPESRKHYLDSLFKSAGI